MLPRILRRQTNANRNGSWRSISFACAVSVVCVIGAAWLMYWGGPVTARQRWLEVIENTPPTDLPGFLEDIAQRDESTPLLVDLLNHERGDIAVSARLALGLQLQRWRDLPGYEASRHAAALAELLASRTSEFRAAGRHLAAQIIDEVIHWPLDEEAVDVADVLADCELVLRNDPGPASLLDIAPIGEAYSHLTPLGALPVGLRSASSSPFPEWDVPHIAGGGLPTEPYSVMEPPTEEALPLADSLSDEPLTQLLTAEALPPGEIYEPLAIPLRLAPLFHEYPDATTPIRSNQPVTIAGPGYQPAEMDDVQLMRHLHDPAKGTLAEEQLRLRGFDSLRLEIARRLTHADPQVRKELANALPQLSGVDARAWLEELAADRDPTVRRVAISILGTSGDPSVETLLNQIRQEESNPQVAELIDGILEKRR